MVYSIPSLLAVIVGASLARVSASSCQQDCDCAFDGSGDGDESDATLRYEVMAGLIGGFAPLVLGGLGLLTYKLCTRSAANGMMSAPPAGTSHPFNHNAWRQQEANQGTPRGGRAPPPYGNGGRSTPISLYGESDDDLVPGNSVSQVGANGLGGSPYESGSQASGSRPRSVGSRFTNIHRNVKSDNTNRWLRNVNLKKY